MKAILRVTKQATIGSIAAMEKHIQRLMEVPNADPSRKHLNVELLNTQLITDLIAPKDISNTKLFIANGNGSEAVKSYLEVAKSKGVLMQKNSVKAIDHLLTASPEFWTSATKEQKKDFYKSCYRFLADTYGGNRIVSMHLHLDETSPHIHALVIPICKGKLKSGREVLRLSAKHYLGGREKMRALQTKFHSYVKHLGLERGNEKSKAEHTTIKKFYSDAITYEEAQKEIKRMQEQIRIMKKENPALKSPINHPKPGGKKGGLKR